MAMNRCHTVPLLLPDLLGLRYVGARQSPLSTSSLLLAQATVQEPVVFPCGGCGRDETSVLGSLGASFRPSLPRRASVLVAIQGS